VTDLLTPVEQQQQSGYFRRRTGYILPVILLGVSAFIGWGTITMEVPALATFPGPQVFPSMVAVAALVLAVILAISVHRNPEPASVDSTTDADEVEFSASVRPSSNWKAIAFTAGTIIVFIVVLNPLGWLLAGAFLFWGVARGLGSKRPLFDIGLSLAISSIVQLAFSAGLGLNLPPGILAGVF